MRYYYGADKKDSIVSTKDDVKGLIWLVGIKLEK